MNQYKIKDPIIEFANKQELSILRHHNIEILYCVLLHNKNQLPQNLKTLKKLRGISLFASAIKTLPPSILKLSKLEFLSIMESSLSKLDSRFLNLTKLNALEISVKLYKQNRRFIPKHLRYKKEFEFSGEQYIKLAKYKKDLTIMHYI